jgi:hypothetical protein
MNQNQIRKQKAELQKEYSTWQALPDKIGMTACCQYRRLLGC